MDRKVITKVLIDPCILITTQEIKPECKIFQIYNSPDIRRYFLEVLPKIERTSPVIPIKEVIPMVIQRQVDKSWIISCYQSGNQEFQMAAPM